MIKLGIIGAMDVEVATLKEQMEGLEAANIAGMEFCTGKLEGLGIMCLGIIFLLTALFVYNAPYKK